MLRWPSTHPEPPPARLEIRVEEPYVSVAALVEGVERRVQETAPPPPARREDPRDGFGEAPDPGRELVLQTLRDHGWSYVRTAAALGITVDRLYRLRIKYGIERPV